MLQPGFQTLVADSPPILIKPRDPKEMAILNDLAKSYDDPNRKLELERAIFELPPGTLQNLFKYELLSLELMELAASENGIDEEVTSQILEIVAKIEDFLKPLHEIERENLKRLLGKRYYIEEKIQKNEKLRQRFTEVFDEQIYQRYMDQRAVFLPKIGTDR
jgi:hypothetical protein